MIAKDLTFYGSDKEDKFVYEAFGLIPNDGVFVDVGAGDGVTGSNTYFFEKNGWTGVCIDADPRNVEKLQESRKIGIGALISNKEGTQKFYMAKSTPDISGLIKTKDNDVFNADLEPVKLERILTDRRIGDIDILSIDTEGSEIDVFESMNWKKHKPKLLIIEVITQGVFNKEIQPYFESKGYHMVTEVGANQIFALKKPIVRNPKRIIYGSSYDRGLEHLLKIWPDIIKEVPDAQLHIFYGWNLFDLGYADNPERMAWKDKINKLMEQPGIAHMGRISHDECTIQNKLAGIWAYPCVTGDTLIDMPRDYTKYPVGVPIKNLVGKKDVLVWSFNEDSGEFELKKARAIKKTREGAKIIKINWTDGTRLRLTPEHKVLTYKRGWIEAGNLEVGESVVALKKHTQIQVSIGRGSWPYEHRVVAEKIFGKLPKGYHVDHKDGNSLNNSPDNLQLLSPKEHSKKTFKGMIKTKQSIEKQIKSYKRWTNTKEGKKKLSDNGRKRANKFWDNITPEEKVEFLKKRKEKQQAGYKKWWNSLSVKEKEGWGDSGRESRWNHKVASIEDAGYKDVYDMEVEDNHNFIAGGVVVHNCHFGEISCITAMRAQAYGAIPVVIDYAAVKETVQHGIKVPGDIYDKETKDLYKKELISLLKDEKRQKKLRKPMMKWAKEHFAWSKVAKQWDEEFKKEVTPEETAMKLIMEDEPMEAIEILPMGKLRTKLLKKLDHMINPEAYVEKYANDPMNWRPEEVEMVRHDWILDEGKDAKNLLDLGCYEGTLLKKFGKKAKGVEMCKEAVKLGKKRGLDMVQGDACTYSDSDRYDVVSACELIEHVPSPEKLMENMLKLVSDDGWCYVTTPNGATDPKGTMAVWENKDALIDHVRSYNPEKIKKLLHGLEYEIVVHDTELWVKFRTNLEVHVDALLEDNQALKAWELVKDRDFKYKDVLWQKVKHAFNKEDYIKYYSEDLVEDPVSEEMALDCTKLYPRLQWLVDRIEKQNPKSVLDLGCADGYLGLTLAKRGIKCKGVNLYEPSIKVARERATKYNLDAKFKVGDIFDVKEKADAVILFEILEHLPDAKKAIEHCMSLLNKGGRLYISTPCQDSLGIELHKAEAGSTDWNDTKPSGHLRIFSEEELRDLFKEYKIVDLDIDSQRNFVMEVSV